MGVEESTSDPTATEDPIEYFLTDMTYHGRTERTRAAYDRVLRDFESFVLDSGASLRAPPQRVCLAWVHQLRETHAPSTVASYASYVHRFYAYMSRIGAVESNPMALVTEEMDESIETDPTRRDVSLPDMRTFFESIGHPLHRALIGTLLKTGMRVGECCNLDLRDVYLDESEVLEAFEVDLVAALEGRPDSLFVSSEPSRGGVHNGEERSASNKRKRDTVIPIDGELKRLLKAWLAIRPDTDSPALFCSTTEWGRRTTPAMVRAIVRDHASEHGWYARGGDAAENVTPHYFRHFFTTHLRDATGDRGVVKYLRGDVASDVIDTYTHDWGDRIREVYEGNIYRLT